MTEKVIHNRVAELAAAKERREGRRITQRTLAEETGLPLSTVARWHRNDVTRMDHYIAIVFMEYFSCSLSEFFVVEEVPDEGQNETPLVIPA